MVQEERRSYLDLCHDMHLLQPRASSYLDIMGDRTKGATSHYPT